MSSSEAPAPESAPATTTDPPPPENVKPYIRKKRDANGRTMAWRARRHLGRPRKELAPGVEVRKEVEIVLHDHTPELKTFDIADFRMRLRSKSENAAEMAIDELRERLVRPTKAARIPTSVLMRVLKYLDERNVEIATRMKEEGLEAAVPIENHRHLAVFQFPTGVFEGLPPQAQQAIEEQRLRAIETNGG